METLKPREVEMMKSKVLEGLERARAIVKQLEDDVMTALQRPDMGSALHGVASAFCTYSESARNLEKQGPVGLCEFLRKRVSGDVNYEMLLQSL